MNDSQSNITTVSSQEDIDQVKQEQQQKIENLKTLLIKAKQTIQKYKQENTKIQEENNQIKQKNTQMEELIQKYLDSDENGEAKSGKIQNNQLKVQEVQAKIVLNGIDWVCVKFDNYSIEWLRQEHFDQIYSKNKENIEENNNLSQEEKDAQQKQENIQKKPTQIIEMPTCIDYDRFAKQEQENNIKSKNYDEDLKNVIQQYEERIKRLHENQEDFEGKLEKMQKQVKQYKQILEQNKQKLIQMTNIIIDESENIRENCLLFLAEELENEQDDSQKKEQAKAIKFLLIKLQNLNFEYELDSVNNLKDHILVQHQTLFDCLQKQKLQRDESLQEIKNWKEKAHKINNQYQVEKREKMEILEQGRKAIKELEQTSEKYKSNTILEMKEKDEKIKMLNKELQKNVNNMYLKNVLIKFFTSEKKVQKKMFKGVETVLQLTQDESKEVQEKMFAETGGIKGMFGF